jgi:hypothetical protein
MGEEIGRTDPVHKQADPAPPPVGPDKGRDHLVPQPAPLENIGFNVDIPAGRADGLENFTEVIVAPEINLLRGPAFCPSGAEEWLQ